MWWLSFRGGCAAIIKASSLAHARILATLNDPGQVSRFSEGYSIRADQAALIPANSIGRTLSPVEVRQLLELLEDARGSDLPIPPARPRPSPPRPISGSRS
jgi:hypothetical protein